MIGRLAFAPSSPTGQLEGREQDQIRSNYESEEKGELIDSHR
jgi:hypothetical protein